MKKIFQVLNILMVIVCLVLLMIYREVGGTVMKGITSSGFAILGILNLIYALCRREQKWFPGWMAAALVTTAAADVVLQFHFLVGTAVFALGHFGYLAAYCGVEKFRKGDLIPTACVLAVTLGVIMFLLHVEDPVMQVMVVIYGVIISFMLGKAVGSVLAKPDPLRVLLCIGSVMFWFSDLMLAWNLFAGGGHLASQLCLFTYWPGQTLLAHSMFYYGVKE